MSTCLRNTKRDISWDEFSSLAHNTHYKSCYLVALIALNGTDSHR